MAPALPVPKQTDTTKRHGWPYAPRLRPQLWTWFQLQGVTWSLATLQDVKWWMHSAPRCWQDINTKLTPGSDRRHAALARRKSCAACLAAGRSTTAERRIESCRKLEETGKSRSQRDALRLRGAAGLRRSSLACSQRTNYLLTVISWSRSHGSVHTNPNEDRITGYAYSPEKSP